MAEQDTRPVEGYRRKLSEQGILKLKTNSINDDYEVQWGHKLGLGITGPVRLCKNRVTGERFALKCLTERARALQEVQLQYKCSESEHVVRIYDVYSNDVKFPSEPEPRQRILIVMELMEGGELFDRISKKKRFTESEAAQYTKQIALAVKHCHSCNVAHRDIKPENLLLKDDSEDAAVKLTDFGFAKFDDGNLVTPRFTPYYVAPQVLEAQQKNMGQCKGQASAVTSLYMYDKSCDMWSVGVIVYIMLCGYPPFYSEVPSQQISHTMRRRILAGQYEFPAEDWSHISADAIDLVSRLLKVDPEKRLTADQLIVHPWLHKAPHTELLSARVLSDKLSFEEAKEEHAHQLTTMRLPDQPVNLKPLLKINNPLLKKRNRLEPPFQILGLKGLIKSDHTTVKTKAKVNFHLGFGDIQGPGLIILLKQGEKQMWAELASDSCLSSVSGRSL